MILRLTLILSLLCAGLIGLTRLTPSRAPASVLARNPCALPCFFGVMPGQTTRAETLQVLARYVQPTIISDYLLVFPLVDSEGRVISVSISFDANEEVESVRVIASDLFADVGRLGDLLLADQQPHRLFRTCKQVFPVHSMMTFGQYDQLLIELPPGSRLTPDTPITILDLSTVEARALHNARASLGCTIDSVWRGFAAAWKYHFALVE